MSYLKENGICVYIYLPCEEIEKRINNRDSRGIAAEKDETLKDIYDYRTPFYEKYADIRIDCSDSTVEENVAKIKLQILSFLDKA